jgi:protein-tyrosine phosphatase
MWSELHRIEGPWPGWLAIALRPRGGDWLEDEVRAWRKAGLGVLVSALTPEEIGHFHLADEGKICAAHGIEYELFAIPDRDVPASVAAVGGLVERLESRLRGGTHVAIHCRQGIGRSGLLAACTLAVAGVGTSAAW